MNKLIREKIKKILLGLKNEESGTSTMGVATGGVAVGGDAVATPYAFARRGMGNTRAATQVGYKLAKPIKRTIDKVKENQKYSEPAFSTPALNIEPNTTYFNKDGLVQHNDPDLDPNLIGMKQGRLPVGEGVHTMKYEQSAEAQPTQPPAPAAQPAKANPAPNINVQPYDVQTDFGTFDVSLKKSTEALKNNLQQSIQNKILGKKIVARSSKGYKQPETDYTINVTGVAIDYYYDRYVIVVMGREESKQKVAKFFIKTGVPIKVLGAAENLKPKDQYQLAKSKALSGAGAQDSSLKNTVTSDAEDFTASPPVGAPAAGAAQAPAAQPPTQK